MKRCPACLHKYPQRYIKCPYCRCVMPDQDEITAACKLIQQRWTRTQERERSTSNPVPARIHVATLVHYRDDE